MTSKQTSLQWLNRINSRSLVVIKILIILILVVFEAIAVIRICSLFFPWTPSTQVMNESLTIDASVLHELNKQPYRKYETGGCIRTNCNISNNHYETLDCSITRVEQITDGVNNFVEMSPCFGYDGNFHTHPGLCWFSEGDRKAFKSQNHWLSVLMCGENKFVYMTKNDYREKLIMIENEE